MPVTTYPVKGTPSANPRDRAKDILTHLSKLSANARVFIASPTGEGSEHYPAAFALDYEGADFCSSFDPTKRAPRYGEPFLLTIHEVERLAKKGLLTRAGMVPGYGQSFTLRHSEVTRLLRSL